MILNQSAITHLQTAYNAAYKKGREGFKPQTVWSKIATEVPSTGAQNDYPFLGHFPSLRKWVGDRFIKNLEQHGYSIRNEAFEATVGVKTEDIRRDNYGVYTPMMADMGMSAEVWPDELIFALFKLALTAKCYDKQPFFDTDHPVAGVSKSNYGGGSGSLWALLDTRRPLKPFIFQLEVPPKLQVLDKPDSEGVFMQRLIRFGIEAWGNAGFGFWQQAYGSKDDITEEHVDEYINAMSSLESDEGKKLGIVPNVLICGTSRRAEAETLLEKQLTTGGETNRYYKKLELIVTPYLD